MFLHLIPDEKFIDDAIARFERIDPGQHVFVYFTPTMQVSFKHLKQTDKITIVPLYSSTYYNYLENINQFKAVFVHSLLCPHFVEFINCADRTVTFVWLFWGAEFWTLKQFKTQAYLPLTKILYYKQRPNEKLKKLKVNLDKYTNLFFSAGPIKTIGVVCDKLIHPSSMRPHFIGDGDIIKAIRRADYIIPVVKDDFDVLKRLLPCRAEFLDWNYSLGLPLHQLDTLSISGRNILVGNSGSYTNNHWDIFVKVKKYAALFDKMIVPLSYGDPVYTQSILKKGKRLLGNKFNPLLDFLPIQDYFSQIGSCYAAIFNSIRQQAMGNIIVSLYLGAKVFLRRENPIYLFLKNQGAAVFAIEKELNPESLRKPLSEEKKGLNKKIIKTLYSEESLDEKTQRLIFFLNNRKKSED